MGIPHCSGFKSWSVSRVITGGIAIFLVAAVPKVVCAGVMLSPVAVLGTDLGTFSSSAPLGNMINQSGLAVSFVSGSTDFDTYFASPNTIFADNTYTNNWQSDTVFNLPLTGYVDFDLGAIYKLNRIAIWNNSLSNVAVIVATSANELGIGTIAGQYKLTDHTHFPYSYPPDVRDFDRVVQGRYVRLQISSAYKYDTHYSWAYATIGEVILSAIPEIATPTISIARKGNGDVEVTFTGVLQSASSPNGIYQDVPGNPQGTYVTSAASLNTQTCFRARGK